MMVDEDDAHKNDEDDAKKCYTAVVAVVNAALYINTKSTDAQGKLKPRSVIMREEGKLGFLIIPRAQKNS